MARKALLGIPLALLPSVSLFLAVPLIWGVWSKVLEGRVALSLPMLLVFSAAVAAAVLAAPGYFVAAFEEKRLVSMKRAGRWWIRSSLTAGVVASLVAVPPTFFLGRWLWLFPAGTLAGCLLLYLRSERTWRLPPGENGYGDT